MAGARGLGRSVVFSRALAASGAGPLKEFVLLSDESFGEACRSRIISEGLFGIQVAS